MRFARLFPLSLVAGFVLSVGCSKNEDPAASSESTGQAETVAVESSSEAATAEVAAEDVKKVPSASLPPTQGVSPAVDGGRLQIPLLSSWTVPPRTSEWLFRLQRDRKTAYPQILVTVDESFEPQVEKLNKTNVGEFVPVWQKHLDKTHDAKSFGEPVSAVRIGKRHGVECLIHSVAGKMSLEQLMVTMIGAGRVYTLELRAQRGTLEDYRMDFYAVVAGTTIELPAENPAGFGPMKEDPAEEAAEESEDAAPAAETDKK
jgi:hypothetical protein